MVRPLKTRTTRLHDTAAAPAGPCRPGIPGREAGGVPRQQSSWQTPDGA